MSLPFAVRLRAHAAGLEEVVARVAAGGRDAADLAALAAGPLPLLAATASLVSPGDARVVGLLPVAPCDPVEKVLARRDAAEAEVVVLSATANAAGFSSAEGAGRAADSGNEAGSGHAAGDGNEAGSGHAAGSGNALRSENAAPLSLNEACTLVERLLAELRGATARIDTASLAALAAAAGATVEDAAARLSAAGVTQLEVLPGGVYVGPLEPTFSVVAASTPDLSFVEALLARPPSSLVIRLGEDATGVGLLRAVALARLAGHGPIAVGGTDELKGPDACLAFGADRLEARLDPPGAMGSRTRAYGEAAVRGAQLALRPPARRAKAGKAVAHILDEHVDPEALPGGDVAAPLPIVAPRASEVRS
ncbi:MAG TPA: hypothetical protein VGD74_11970 [Vulgatibacter sp.]